MLGSSCIFFSMPLPIEEQIIITFLYWQVFMQETFFPCTLESTYRAMVGDTGFEPVTSTV